MSGSQRPVRFEAFQASIIRACDLLLAVVGLLVTAPVFPVVALFIKLDSRGPVFYPAPRVGKGMKIFGMYKFRTMLDRATAINQSICAQYDPRVTNIGRILRRTKLNELPQLLNILKGEMSFVGPRPEAPDLAERYPLDAKAIFSVKPGLVGPVVISQLKGGVIGRNEEELYPQGADPEQYYIDHILPEKVKIDLYHLSRQTVAMYFRIILSAAVETVMGVLNARQVDRGKRQAYLFLADWLFSLVAYAFAYRLHLRLAGIGISSGVFLHGLLLVMFLRPLVFYALGLYKLVLDLITTGDLVRAIRAVSLGSVLLFALGAFRLTFSFPPDLVLIDFALLSILVSGSRLLIMARSRGSGRTSQPDLRPRALIFGANPTGLKALRVLGASKNGPYRIVGFIDDAEEKYARKISGIKVLGNRHHLGALAVLHNIQEVILAPEGASRDTLDEVVSLSARAGLRSRMFTTDAGVEPVGRVLYSVRSVQVADLLPQVDVPVDEGCLHPILSDKTTLMMGSGGELGAAVCRYIYRLGCRTLIIVDRYEARLSRLMAELIADLPGFRVVPVVADGGDIQALEEIFLRHRPRIVLHAGLRKFIPFQKTTDEEVARANYLGTFNLARVAARHGCDYFVVISSINAARRGSFISESLRVAEFSLSRIFSPTSTRLIVNRVGNIIENSGGIVAWLNERILQRRPIPRTAETARAFLLSSSAGARSILQSLATGSRISPGGLLLTSEPGIGLEYGEVARRIASLYGLLPGFDQRAGTDEIPGALFFEEPREIAAVRDLEFTAGLRDYLGGEAAMEMIQSLTLSETGSLSKQELRRRTREILTLVDRLEPAPKKNLSLNN